jgi:5-methylcytosine-specific restriction enzyme subunit McrC
VQLHRNNAYYDLLLKVAELAFDCLLPDPSGKGFMFQDVLRDERKMAAVFEEFVRNFYRVEQQRYSVEPLSIQWDATPLTSSAVGQLPNMRVDVFLRSAVIVR